MNITCFDDLLQVARQQPEPQRLLMVFVAVELPEDSTPEQREKFEQGLGGSFLPLARVDKTLDELSSFAQLTHEASMALPDYPPWALVLVAGLSGKNGQPPSSQDAETPLQHMVESIRAGQVNALLPFDRDGLPVRPR